MNWRRKIWIFRHLLPALGKPIWGDRVVLLKLRKVRGETVSWGDRRDPTDHSSSHARTPETESRPSQWPSPWSAHNLEEKRPPAEPPRCAAPPAYSGPRAPQLTMFRFLGFRVVHLKIPEQQVQVTATEDAAEPSVLTGTERQSNRGNTLAPARCPRHPRRQRSFAHTYVTGDSPDWTVHKAPPTRAWVTAGRQSGLWAELVLTVGGSFPL